MISELTDIWQSLPRLLGALFPLSFISGNGFRVLPMDVVMDRSFDIKISPLDDVFGLVAFQGSMVDLRRRKTPMLHRGFVNCRLKFGYLAQ
jgi:hypothetical protein